MNIKKHIKIRNLIRAWNDINVDMCKSINLIGFGERRYDLYKKSTGH